MLSPFLFIFISFSLFLPSFVHAEFSTDFRAFIHNKYGIPVVNMLERRDLGADASTGGREAGGGASQQEPVVIVHGITNRISRFNHIINVLRGRGNEVFATTWGDGGVTPAGLVELKCSYVKQIRSLIISVREYTGKKVDVIAYSMGSPLARKAILGGICVDTRELLGPPLTEHIDTFLSVGGSNYGSILCLVPLPLGTCNKKNGLHCESEFLADVNAQTAYEGAQIFSIFSTDDEKIGFRTCSRLASPIVGGTGFVKKHGLSHDDILDKTIESQISFIQRHRP